MLARFIRRLAVWTSVCLLAAAGGSAAIAKNSGQGDEGKVEAVEVIYGARDDNPVNAGTVIGGIAGGVLGHQIGGGRGKTAATVAGTIGGAVVGNQIQKKQGEGTPRYRITVRLDSGNSVVVEDTRDPNLRVGDRVRITDGQVHRL